jgi:peptide chain release factor 2
LLEGVVNTIDTMDSGLIDARDLLDLAVEENDQDTLDEVQSELDALTMGLEKLEFRRMFSGEMDANAAF